MESLLNHQKRALVGGAVAGAVGGILMLVLPVTRSLLQDQDPWIHFKLASAAYPGMASFQRGFELWPVLVGTSVHLLLAQLWGAIFASACYGRSRVATLGAGLGLGLIAFALMTYLVLPMVGAGGLVSGRALDPWLSLHLLFGFFTGLAFLAFQRELDADTMRRLIQEAQRADHRR